MLALMLVAEHDGPTMFARIGVMRALNRHVERVFDRRARITPESRCLVPANSFSEYNDVANPNSLKNDDGMPHAMAGTDDNFAATPFWREADVQERPTTEYDLRKVLPPVIRRPRAVSAARQGPALWRS